MHDIVSAQVSEQSELVVTVLDDLLNVKTSDDLIRCTKGSLQALIPHDVMFAAIGTLTANGPNFFDFVAYNYPWGFLADIQHIDGEISSGLLDHWLASGEPQLFGPDQHMRRVSSKWLSAFRQHDLRNFISHGVMPSSLGRTMTYFAFARIPIKLTLKHLRIMRLVAPFIHLALSYICAAPERVNGPALMSENSLNERQRDILRWVWQGKTNWEIARILGLTEKAVKYHLGRIFQRLQVTNRTQAAVKAVAMRLIKDRAWAAEGAPTPMH